VGTGGFGTGWRAASEGGMEGVSGDGWVWKVRACSERGRDGGSEWGRVRLGGAGVAASEGGMEGVSGDGWVWDGRACSERGKDGGVSGDGWVWEVRAGSERGRDGGS